MVPPCSDRMSRVPPYSRTDERMSRTGLSPIVPGFPACSAIHIIGHWPDPRSLATTDGVSLMSFPRGTEMFQFPRFAFGTYGFSSKYLHRPSSIPALQAAASQDRARRPRIGEGRRWVSPFGNPGIKACSRLPPAYRSVPRPSSPLSAKASTRYPYDT